MKPPFKIESNTPFGELAENVVSDIVTEAYKLHSQVEEAVDLRAKVAAAQDVADMVVSKLDDLSDEDLASVLAFMIHITEFFVGAGGLTKDEYAARMLQKRSSSRFN